MPLLNKRLLQETVTKHKHEVASAVKQDLQVLFKDTLTRIESGKFKKEESEKVPFLQRLFELLGYKLHENLEFEYSTQGRSIDGVLGLQTEKGRDVEVAIEWKGVDTKNLSGGKAGETPVSQMWDYMGKVGAEIGIVGNFLEFRIYTLKTKQTDYQDYFLRELINQEDKLDEFIFLLKKSTLLKNDNKQSFLETLISQSEAQQEQITKRFYNDYKQRRLNLFEHLVENNSQYEAKDKITLGNCLKLNLPTSEKLKQIVKLSVDLEEFENDDPNLMGISNLLPLKTFLDYLDTWYTGNGLELEALNQRITENYYNPDGNKNERNKYHLTKDLISICGDAGINKNCFELIEYFTTELILQKDSSEILKENRIEYKYLLLEKSQKVLDRLVFIMFCEDGSLLPGGTIRKVFENARNSFGSENKIWDQFKGLFLAIDKGSDYPKINAFNGGLFAEDLVLNNLTIKDNIWQDLIKLSEYDFESDLNVNILGHIFEQSISDIEEIKNEIENNPELNSSPLERGAKKTSKRKKDGIYYTPEYITDYIVSETIGSWLKDKEQEAKLKNYAQVSEKLCPPNDTFIDLEEMDICDKYRKNYSRAVVYNPKTNKFLFTHFANCQNPTKWGLVGGSLEDEEDVTESLKREITEETGLTDFTIVCKLGGKIISPKDPEFDNKDLIKVNYPYLVILNSEDIDQTKLNFSKNELKTELSILWLKPDEVKFEGFYKQYSHILDRALTVLKEVGEVKNITTDDLNQIKVLDPAGGSGAFPNQVHNFLAKKHVEQIKNKAESEGFDPNLVDIDEKVIDKSILKNNIFMVDLQPESVEIAKLSLWLKTAKKDQKLNNLDSNIKCGNSLIDDPKIAGDTAFDWEKEFGGLKNSKSTQ